MQDKLIFAISYCVYMNDSCGSQTAAPEGVQRVLFVVFSMDLDHDRKFWHFVCCSQKKSWKNFFSYMGPGFLVSIAYIDPGNCEISITSLFLFWLYRSYHCAKFFNLFSYLQLKQISRLEHNTSTGCVSLLLNLFSSLVVSWSPSNLLQSLLSIHHTITDFLWNLLRLSIIGSC